VSRAAAAALLTAAALAAGCGGSKGGGATTADGSARAAGASSAGGSARAPRDVVGGELPVRDHEMTLRQAIGQHFVFAYSGARPPRALVARIRRGEAAGVILFARNVGGVAAVRREVRRLQAIPRPPGLDAPLLVMVDQEGGDVRRLPGPPATSAAATRTTTQARANGHAAGKLLRGAGVNVDLAPVVDVGREGSALEGEGRTYARTPARVAALAGAFAQGLQQAGVRPVLKHFPGFGAATINTDDGIARVDLPLSTLRAVDIDPYKKLRPGAVMLSTAVYPRVDPRPAAFSRRWVTTELRRGLPFSGVTLTDDLQAPAVARYGSPAQLAYFALRAGVDLPLFAKSYTAAARAAQGLQQAVRSGSLSRSDLEAGARRVLLWRASPAGPGRAAP
jgi:beta-N-acetylhexosaminidase